MSTPQRTPDGGDNGREGRHEQHDGKGDNQLINAIQCFCHDPSLSMLSEKKPSFLLPGFAWGLFRLFQFLGNTPSRI